MDLRVISLLYFRKAIPHSDMSKMTVILDEVSRPGGATCYLESYESSYEKEKWMPRVNLWKTQKIHMYYDSCPLKVYEKVIMDTFGFQDFNREDLLKHRSMKL
jgi:hypothetical protein